MTSPNDGFCCEPKIMHGITIDYRATYVYVVSIIYGITIDIEISLSYIALGF